MTQTDAHGFTAVNVHNVSIHRPHASHHVKPKASYMYHKNLIAMDVRTACAHVHCLAQKTVQHIAQVLGKKSRLERQIAMAVTHVNAMEMKILQIV